MMNTKVIEQPQNETIPKQNNESAGIDQFFSKLFNTINTGESEKGQLPIILSDLKPVVSFQNLQLKLHGIVYNRREESYALISKNGGVQEVYQQGALVFKNTVLKEISKNQVLIKYYSNTYVLKMGLKGGVDIPSYLHQDKKDFFQQQLILDQDKSRNPIRLLMIRRPYAVYENNQFLGYIIMPGSNADQFVRLGFESGDIITNLNGLMLDKPGLQPFIIRELTHSSNIDLILLRGKDTVSILYGF